MGNTKVRRRHSALAAAVATVAMAVGFTALPAEAAPPQQVEYVALGDSYAAGQGAVPYTDPACFVSRKGYPAIADNRRDVLLTTNAACSGKTTQDVVTTQLRQLNLSTELVTITAGGNNLGFGQIITYCITALSDPTAGPACDTATAHAEEQITSGQLTNDVITMIQSVRAAAPEAKIVVTGYPYLYDPVAPNPADPLSLFIGRATLLANGLNGSIATAAFLTNVEYVDVVGAFAGHGVNSLDPWINLDTTNPGSPDNFHPNGEGYRHGYYASLVNQDAFNLN